MPSPIGTPLSFVSNTGLSRTGLEAQLARYEKERSACVNCESADTLDGKLDIQQLDAKIRTIQVRLQSVPESRSVSDLNDTASATATSPDRIDVYA